MDHTVCRFHLQITSCLPLHRKRSPDGASPDWGYGHLIAAYYSFIYPERMKGWVGLVGWPIADGLPTKVVPVSRRSSAGQGKFVGQRPTFYHCATQPTKRVCCVTPCWLADLHQTVYPQKWYPSAAGRAQDRESSPVKDRHSTTVPRNQPSVCVVLHHVKLAENK